MQPSKIPIFEGHRRDQEGVLQCFQKREGEALAIAYKSREHKEAVQAFIEKRKPDFS